MSTDNNNSQISQVPTGTAGTAATTASTPATSPVSERLAADTNNINSTTAPAIAAAINPAELEAKSADAQFSKVLSSKHTELVACVRDLCSLQASARDTVALPQQFSWGEVLEASEKAFAEYTAKMESLTVQQEALHREMLVWQEGAYMLDAAVVGERLSAAEEWSKAKESFVRYSNGELLRTSEIIDSAIKKLKESSTSRH